jgi:hypothetical protein
MLFYARAMIAVKQVMATKIVLITPSTKEHKLYVSWLILQKPPLVYDLTDFYIGICLFILK